MNGGQNFDRKYRDGIRGKEDCLRAGVFLRERVGLVLWLGGKQLEDEPLCDISSHKKGVVYIAARNDSAEEIDIEYTITCLNQALQFIDNQNDFERKGT